MATCDVSALIAEAKCFLPLTEKELDLAIVQLLREWSGDTSTPAELIRDAKCILALETRQIELLQTQILCEIASG